MHKNIYWLTFLSIVAIATLWFGMSAIRAVQNYLAMSEKAPLFSGNWSYEEVSTDTYAPHVIYHYRIGDACYRGDLLMRHPLARNPQSAEQMIDSLATQQWDVWYDPSHPHRSSLQKTVPIQECLSALTLLGVFAYLVWLGYSVGMTRS
jgi:hypothetical protein